MKPPKPKDYLASPIGDFLLDSIPHDEVVAALRAKYPEHVVEKLLGLKSSFLMDFMREIAD